MNISKKNSLFFSKKEKNFSNCSLKKEQIEGRLLSINSKFLAILTKNRGEIVIVDSSNPCDIKENNNYNRIKSNNYGQILDIEFSPHNNNILASANQYNLLFWKIPDENFNNISIEECQMHHEHNNKINYISFNPVIKDMICTSDLDNKIFVWNDEKLESYNDFQLDEKASMIEWNPKGDLIGVTTEKKYINIIDSREKNIILKKKISISCFTPKFVWVDDNSFAVIGSSMNDKSSKNLKLWDIRNIKEGETDKGEKASVQIDKDKFINSTPFINRELKLIYVFKVLSPKVDVFNYSEGNFEKETYDINLEPSFSLLFNKKMLDSNKNEIDRFVICSKDNIYYESVFSSDEHYLKNIDNNVSFSNDDNNILNEANQSIDEENLENENDENLNDQKDNNESVKEIKDENNNDIKGENDIVNFKDIKDENIEENNNKDIKDGDINEIKDGKINEIKDEIKEDNNRGNNNGIKDDNNKENNNEKNSENNNVIQEENKELNEEKLEKLSQNQKEIINDSDKQNKLNIINPPEEESNKIQNLEDDNIVIENEEIINNILDENELLGNENDNLKKENKKYLKLKDEFNLKAKECEDLHSENNKLSNKAREQEDMISKINEEINEYEKKISILEKEKEIKNKEINDKKNQIDEYKNKILNLENEIQKEEEMNSSKINAKIESIKEDYEKKLQIEFKKIEKELIEKMENKFSQYKNELKKNKFDKINESISSCETIHYGIKCEKCFQEPIKGYRYKCSVCSDYNLCDNCKEENSIKNDHLHNFIKINKDQNNNQDNYSNYSYECIKIEPEVLEVFDGTEQANIEITLKNNGDEAWPENKTKLSFDNESELKDEDIVLAPQAPGEEKNYLIKFTGLGDKNLGEYISNLSFFINDRQIGEKLTLKIKILDSRVLNFANEKDLDLEEYTYKRLLDVLRENNFDFDNAFASLF